MVGSFCAGALRELSVIRFQLSENAVLGVVSRDEAGPRGARSWVRKVELDRDFKERGASAARDPWW